MTQLRRQSHRRLWTLTKKKVKATKKRSKIHLPSLLGLIFVSSLKREAFIKEMIDGGNQRLTCVQSNLFSVQSNHQDLPERENVLGKNTDDSNFRCGELRAWLLLQFSRPGVLHGMFTRAHTHTQTHTNTHTHTQIHTHTHTHTDTHVDTGLRSRLPFGSPPLLFTTAKGQVRSISLRLPEVER